MFILKYNCRLLEVGNSYSHIMSQVSSQVSYNLPEDFLVNTERKNIMKIRIVVEINKYLYCFLLLIFIYHLMDITSVNIYSNKWSGWNQDRERMVLWCMQMVHSEGGMCWE